MIKKMSSDFWSRRKCTPSPEKILATPTVAGTAHSVLCPVGGNGIGLSGFAGATTL